ncbi:hypothetical protein I230019B6_06460 [Firmicutes bacterium i23-0019-B6]
MSDNECQIKIQKKYKDIETYRTIFAAESENVLKYTVYSSKIELRMEVPICLNITHIDQEQV